jgi:hypothetical protein
VVGHFYSNTIRAEFIFVLAFEVVVLRKNAFSCSDLFIVIKNPPVFYSDIAFYKSIGDYPKVP